MPRPKRAEPRYYLRKRPDNGIWEIRWFDGQPRSASTGVQDEAEAQRRHAQWITDLKRPRAAAEPTIDEILTGYLADRRGHVEDYSRLEYCAAHIRRHVGGLTGGSLPSRVYWERRHRDGVAPGTIAREGITLRAALHWAKKEGWIKEAPHVALPPKTAPRERFLTREEADKLLAAARSPHLRLFILLALHTGARRGAILDLTWSQVDLEGRLIQFRRAGRAVTKKRRAAVPINRVLTAELQAARMAAVTEWVIEYKGRKAGNIRHAFERAVERAGIPYCTRHDLRRTAASWMVMAGVPLGEVAKVLGDSEEMIEKVYGRFSPDYLRRAVDALAGPVTLSARHRNEQA